MRSDSYRSRSPDAWDNYAEEGSQQTNNLFSFKDNAVALIALFVAGMCLTGMLWAISVANEAKRQATIDTMRVEGLTRAMIAHGIKDTYPHVPGEDD